MSSGTNEKRAKISPGERTKARLKAAAQALFARYGVEGVTVQQIVSAAGQRNNACLHYHFGSREGLIRQLLVDGAMELDARRTAMLDSLEHGEEPMTVRSLIRVLLVPVLDLAADECWHGYVQFSTNLQLTHREMFREALGGRWNAAYVRTFEHLKALVTHIPPAILDQRLSIMTIYGNAITAVREFEMVRGKLPSRFWSQPFTIENIIDTLETTLTAPPSELTLAYLAEQDRE